MCFPIQAMVATLLTSLGLNHMDMGGLEAARRQYDHIGLTTLVTLINIRIENLPLNLFPSWPLPLAISTLLWFFIYALTFSRDHFCSK